MGKTVVSEIIQPIRQALAGDTVLLDRWRYLPWQKYAPNVIEKYKENSGYANGRSLDEHANNVLEIVIQNPGIRPREIMDRIDRHADDLLKILLDRHVVRKEKNGKQAQYFPVLHPE